MTIALAGNPNVGKSSLFNSLTGMSAVTAHYPGKTVELNVGTTEFEGETIGVVDLPGVYLLEAVSDEQWVARRALLEAQPDTVVAVVDATNLERNLYLVLQLLDLQLPVVVALNLVDEAKRAGIAIDARALSNALGVEVVPVQGTTGAGMAALMAAAVKRARTCPDCSAPSPVYGRDVADHIADLEQMAQRQLAGILPNLSARAKAVLLLENDPEVTQLATQVEGGERLLTLRAQLAEHIGDEHGEAAEMRLARERHGLAGSIATRVRRRAPSGSPWGERLWRWSIAPLTGGPTLLLVLAVVFALLFFVGNYLSGLIEDTWEALASPLIASVLGALFGEGLVPDVLRWGVDAGILAILSVGIPYVMVFYFMLALLEDTGYFNSVSFLLDNVMHRFGLHGRSAIPLVAALGCNVPALISLRSLTSMRERVIASTLVLLIPCSARTAVIMGVVGRWAGIWPALGLIITLGVIGVAAGLALNRILPGESTGLVMEMFPFRRPALRTVLRKTWARLSDFVFVALPIVLIGSMVLGLLYETDYIWLVAGPLQPIVEGWLGLPMVAGLCLIFAVLRKELAMQLLVAIAITQYGPLAESLDSFMNADQLFVYALVNSIYLPCLATIAVLARDLGWARVAGISAFTAILALLAGGIANQVLALI
ncbi:MAG: ferrous iron transport protein B [Chloroflexota bacterium]